MFTHEKSRPGASAKRPTATKDTAVTILTSGCHFTGKLYCRGSTRIGGKIEGEIISEGLLIIEEGAFIAAQITAEEVVVQGVIKGRLKAKTRVELAATCRFEGDLLTPTLVVNEGAHFNGRSQMLIASSQGKVIEPASGFGNSKLPDLKVDQDDDRREPDIAIAKLTEQPV